MVIGFKGSSLFDPRLSDALIHKHYNSRSSNERQQPSSSTLSRASPRQTAWLLLKDPEEAQPYLDELRRKSPEIASAATLAREFCRIIRERDTAAWPKWCEETKTSLLATSYPHRPKGLVEARGGSTPWGSQYKISNTCSSQWRIRAESQCAA